MTATTTYDVTAEDLEEFIHANWDAFLRDAATLIAIDSSLDADRAVPGAPFGPGPRAALDATLAIAKRFGMEVYDGDGYAGYADLPGTSGQQLGVIGHVDVVPAGTGWLFEPFKLTRRDEVLIGRGTTDDKIPVLTALYALKFWIDRGVSLHHTVRFIFGCNEENGMGDVPYYLKHHQAPDFLFTPDAEFPLAYGEKGLFGATFKVNVGEGTLVEFEGGTATNAVPALAHAVLAVDPAELPRAEHIDIDICEGGSLVVANGVGGHASFPEGTRNAIGLLADYLAHAGVCSDSEIAFMTVLAAMANEVDGATVGVVVSDDDFGALTSVIGTARKEGEYFEFTDDVRFPTAITGEKLADAYTAYAKKIGAEVEITRNQEPFIVDSHTAPIQALMSAYEEVTGVETHPFTIGGATYAREFPHAVSFGPADPGAVPIPKWVGAMHGADEGVPEEAVRHAMRIYIRAFGNVAQVKDLRKAQ